MTYGSFTILKRSVGVVELAQSPEHGKNNWSVFVLNVLISQREHYEHLELDLEVWQGFCVVDATTVISVNAAAHQ